MDIGDTIPEFDLPTNGGGQISKSDILGKWAVIYFYPKDSTPGCTTEALDFTADITTFNELGVQVFGVSRDSVKRHDNFVTKNDLKVTLISDEEGKFCEGFGVWVEKKNYGKTYMGIERSTFLIDPLGKIQKTWKKVRVKGHKDDVLHTVRELQSS